MSKETSHDVASMAGRYLHITEEDWASMPLSEQLRVVHSLAASALAQREPDPEEENPQDETP